MPKKIYAVTNIKIGSNEGEYFAAGEEVNTAKFTKDQLLALHSEGAVEVKVVEEEEKPAEETAEPATEPAAEEAAPAEEPADATSSLEEDVAETG